MSALHTENAIVSGVIESDRSCRSFSLAEIQSITNNFDDALVIGIGGFGKVYKGFIDNGTNVVAIKRLNLESKQGAKEFSAEIKMLSKLQHTNLVALIGYHSDCEEKILVYEYISRGTLADHLYKRRRIQSSACNSHLPWEQRLEICVGAARGLDYIHTGTNQSFIHRDVKTTNILVDENWIAKISDFGLSKGSASHSVTHITTDVKGTFGYLDPHYFFTQKLITKSDVYAFGVVLLEVLCGRPSVDSTLEEEKISIILWAQRLIKKGKFDEIIDPSLNGQISRRCLNYFVKVANDCLQNVPTARPTMAEVVESLQLALASQRKGRKEGIVTKVFQGIALVPKSMNRWLRETKDNEGSMSGPSKYLPPESHPDSATLFVRHFSLTDIRAATNNFHKDLVIEKDWSGKIYKGFMDGGTRVLAIKRLLNETLQEIKEVFKAEIEVHSMLCHPNIASLIGFCNEKNELILVYEYDYMVNGSLRHHLDKTDNDPLLWKKRLKICIDAARGLRYLHEGKPAKPVIAHGNIGSSNILLDKNWVAKVTDFTLSKIVPEDSLAEWTTPQRDVKSFGSVLFGVLRPPKKYRVIFYKSNTANKVAAIDPYLVDKIAPDCLREFVTIASSCLTTYAGQRPSMCCVVESLEKALKLQEEWEKLEVANRLVLTDLGGSQQVTGQIWAG